MQINFNIEKFLDLTGYEETRNLRRKTNIKNPNKGTQEFFTPYSIIKKMMDKIPLEDWSNPDKTFMEPCFGNGQFVLYIIWNRIQHGIDWKTALETLFGVELMQDNVRETMDRVHEMLGTICDDYNKEVAENIMKRHLICSDFFDWNFEEWQPYTEEEKKNIKKKK